MSVEQVIASINNNIKRKVKNLTDADMAFKASDIKYQSRLHKGT
jgi:hypothetical protein